MLPSPLEAKTYYYGLPSRPVLVVRTGTTPWRAPTGPEAYTKIRDVRPVGNHALKEVWEGNLALRIHALLDSMNVKWTSTDVVRIGDAGKSPAPVVLWIGVIPASLSGDDGIVVASKCRKLLEEIDITDVDVEIRESVVTRSAGPKLLTSAYSSNATAVVHEPLTTTLGLPICAHHTPWIEGTGGFFITEGGNTDRLLLVTARHVVLAPNENENMHFKHMNNGQPRHDVVLFGDVAFKKYLKFVQDEIRGKSFLADYNERRIRAVEGKDDQAADRERQDAQRELDEAMKAMEELKPFYPDVSTRLATPESRILGHVVLSPPIKFGVGSSSEGYTEDWAVIEIDTSKVDMSNFRGNAIDMGANVPFTELALVMRHRGFLIYLRHRLLRLKGTIPDREMRHPTTLDLDGNPRLLVIKRSNTTGLTIGWANDVCSYTNNYDSNGKAEASKEWAILQFNSKSGAFSEKGDSGAVIVDGFGRIGGLLTGGACSASSSDMDMDMDITYATPISFLLKRMQDNGLYEPNIHLETFAGRTPDEF